ncbi:MAG: Ig-like domain-containing protein [Paracoccaceae bacterium]|nr:Ig-like domain-containing protein [Paracoccaceae bacterium]
MADTGGVSAGRYGWAAVAVLLIGGGLWLARPFFEGAPPDPVSPEIAAQPEADAPEPVAAAPGQEGPAPVATEEAATAPDEDPATPETAAAPEVPAETPVPPQAPATPVPAFDVVRVAPDGESLVAGVAAPGASVSVLVDGEVMGEAAADAAGNFVLLFSMDASDAARVVSLEAEGEGGRVSSEQEIIVAPMPAPVAEAEPSATGEVAVSEPADEGPGTAAEAATSDAGDRAAAETAAVPEAAAASPPAAETAPAAPPSPTLLLSEAGSVRVIQSEGPDVLDRVAIDAITYDVEGEVTLAGRAEGGGFVRVYIDNRPILTTEIDAGGNWRTDLPDVDTGVYTLRVDALDAEGNVTSRAETPFLREPVDAVRTIADGLEADVLDDIVTVQPGDHLWGIATRRYGEGILYVKVFEANKGQIRDPDLIYPGQIFELPE